jgi:hypothetical protein
MSEDCVTVFCTNGDGTVDCAWCGETFNADLAQPDGNLEPTCPDCLQSAEEESLAMTKAEYIENLHFAEGDLTSEQLEAEYVKFDVWRNGILSARAEKQEGVRVGS